MAHSPKKKIESASNTTSSKFESQTTSRPVRTKSNGSRIRLLALLAILIPLAGYTYVHRTYTSAISKIQKSLAVWENERAIQEIKSIENQFGQTGETSFLTARAYRHLGDGNGFRRKTESAKQLGFPLKKINNEVLLLQAQLGMLANVESQMGKIMQEPDTEFEEAATALVYSLLTKQDFTAVVAFLAIWEKNEPKSPWVPLFGSMLALSRRDWKLAQSLLEPAVQANPEFVPFYLHLGSAYSGQLESEKAANAFRRYLQSMPGDPETILKYSVALNKLGKPEEALSQLAPLLESGKANTEMQLQAAKIYLETNQSQKCIDVLSRAASLWPEDVAMASTLSQAYQQLGNEEAAERYAKIADAGQPDVQSVDGTLFKLISNPEKTAEECYQLGHILLHKQSRENGISWLETALRIDPNYLPAHQDLALYYTRTGQTNLAAIHQRFIQQNQKSP